MAGRVNALLRKNPRSRSGSRRPLLPRDETRTRQDADRGSDRYHRGRRAARGRPETQRQRGERNGKRPGADPVHPRRPAGGSRAPAPGAGSCSVQPRSGIAAAMRADSDGHVDEEDEWPPQRVHQEPAENRAQDASHGHRGPEKPHGPSALLRGKGGIENGPRDAERHRPAHCLHRPEDDEQRDAARQAASKGGQGEHAPGPR